MAPEGGRECLKYPFIINEPATVHGVVFDLSGWRRPGTDVPKIAPIFARLP